MSKNEDRIAVRATRDGYRRGGMGFAKNQDTILNVADLSKKQIDAITNDPNLSVKGGGVAPAETGVGGVEAKAEGAEIIKTAYKEAKEIMDTAKKQQDEIVDAANKQAEKIIEDAKAEANQLVADAKEHIATLEKEHHFNGEAKGQTKDKEVDGNKKPETNKGAKPKSK